MLSEVRVGRGCMSSEPLSEPESVVVSGVGPFVGDSVGGALGDSVGRTSDVSVVLTVWCAFTLDCVLQSHSARLCCLLVLPP